ncbi:MAG: site-specific integrase [Phreatobacter sp.]|uniref:tyrosine-type recombinase/integrase n=1 Tax=Phreatobacter sp. TaxID=1966341 RepID=UPI001A5C23B2|nr:site-specific integrase [Phreatobacter sp.]MBL8569550.1 site-specific integrase [Phreatobacter sp.]
MLGHQAKVLSQGALVRVLARVRLHAYPRRDRVIVLLSLRAGLRAGEIAGLTWSMVLNDRGRVGEVINVRSSIAKKGSGRRVPIHLELKRALSELKRHGLRSDCLPERPVIISARGGPMRANSIVNWFVALYAELGLEGCSSHSGRRTFITQAARQAHRAGASLRDVQLLAGHRSIETTQTYIDGDTHAQRRLVNLI